MCYISHACAKRLLSLYHIISDCYRWTESNIQRASERDIDIERASELETERAREREREREREQEKEQKAKRET